MNERKAEKLFYEREPTLRIIRPHQPSWLDAPRILQCFFET